jgi:hypothetical protein
MKKIIGILILCFFFFNCKEIPPEYVGKLKTIFQLWGDKDCSAFFVELEDGRKIKGRTLHYFSATEGDYIYKEYYNNGSLLNSTSMERK